VPNSGYVSRPEPRAWVYWIIRCSSADGRISYLRKLPNGRYNRNGVYATKFSDRNKAIQVANYVIKRQKNVYGAVDWGDCKIEVVKAILERKHALEWPLGVLDKIAKV
jgi:hypothetical protein